jgi:hypothetical protein
MGEIRQILKKNKILFVFKGYTCRFKSEAMSHAHQTQSMREIRLLRGRLPRKGGGEGGLTGMATWQGVV